MQPMVTLMTDTGTFIAEGFAAHNTYKAMVTWEKTGRLGMGFYFRVNTEHLLIGVRGATKPFRSSERNILHSKPLGHSRKPNEAYDLIEAVTPGLRRLELFARRKREGWDSIGMEIDGNDIQETIQNMAGRVPWRSLLQEV